MSSSIKIVLNQKITFQLPAGAISATGISLIQNYIAIQKLTEGEWAELNPDAKTSLLPILPPDWNWQWVVVSGDYRGKFPVRVRQYYHKMFNLKCPDGFIEAIGNFAKSHTAGQDTFIFEFVNRFDWQAGDFGDDRSCYWGGNSGARVMLLENGALAIRFYDDNGKGIGRAWLVAVESDFYIVFNGYGLPGDPTLIIARVFAAYTNLQYKRIYLRNSYSSTLYINGGAGYIVASAATIDTVDEYDFEWDEAYGQTCESCGRLLNDDDTYYGADSYPYCETCFYDRFDTCSRCGEAEYPEDLIYIESEHMSVCDSCRRWHYAECPRCKTVHSKYQMSRVGLRMFCSECAVELRILGDNIE